MSPAIRGATLALVLGLWPGLAWAAPLTADDVVRYTLENHPDLVAARGAVGTAAGYRRDVALFVENPDAELGVAVVGDLVQGGATQPVSLTGEGWHARRAARTAETAATADERRAAFVLATDARAAYVHARAADERARLADEGLSQAGRLRAALEDRGRAGEASPLDVRLARLSEARAASEAIEAHREQAEARTALAAFHPEAAEAELVDPLEVASPSAGSGRSDVISADARAEQAHAELARARASALPPVGVGAMFQRDAGEWDVGPQVAVEVPLWKWNRGDIAAAKADLATAEAEAERLHAVAAAQATTTGRTAAFADETVDRLGDIDADAREALASVERALAAGELGITDAVLIRDEILDGWRAGVDAREARSLARLDAMLAVESDQLLPTGGEAR